MRAAPEPAVESAWFCGHCGLAPARDGAPAPAARVCQACGLGMLLETRTDVVPGGDDPFLVVDARLRVQAASQAAEKLLAIEEDVAVNRPVADLLVEAHAETGANIRLADAVVAALAEDRQTTTFVRPWNTFGVRLRARIALCGPPRAALVVLEGAASNARPT